MDGGGNFSPKARQLNALSAPVKYMPALPFYIPVMYDRQSRTQNHRNSSEKNLFVSVCVALLTSLNSGEFTTKNFDLFDRRVYKNLFAYQRKPPLWRRRLFKFHFPAPL
jgi:hypothetical protein